jgi:hypothetical protein
MDLEIGVFSSCFSMMIFAMSCTIGVSCWLIIVTIRRGALKEISNSLVSFTFKGCLATENGNGGDFVKGVPPRSRTYNGNLVVLHVRRDVLLACYHVNVSLT